MFSGRLEADQRRELLISRCEVAVGYTRNVVRVTAFRSAHDHDST